MFTKNKKCNVSPGNFPGETLAWTYVLYRTYSHTIFFIRNRWYVPESPTLNNQNIVSCEENQPKLIAGSQALWSLHPSLCFEILFMRVIINRHVECGHWAHTPLQSPNILPSQHTRADVHSVLFHAVDPHYYFPFHVGCGCCHDAADAV